LTEPDEKVAHFQGEKQFTFLLGFRAKPDKVNVVTFAISVVLPLKAPLVEFFELICEQDQEITLWVNLSVLFSTIVMEEILVSVGLVSKITSAETLFSRPIEEPRHFLGHCCRALPQPRSFKQVQQKTLAVR
jgi:hypothetical protein